MVCMSSIIPAATHEVSFSPVEIRENEQNSSFDHKKSIFEMEKIESSVK